MSRLTLRLPATLHRQLENLARNEAVSLNQYIVYALTRQTTLAYTVQPVSEEAIRQQQASYSALLQSLGEATFSEIEKALSTRERVKPEKGLRPEVIRALKQRVARQRASA
jgi:uncharacterized protein YpbB